MYINEFIAEVCLKLKILGQDSSRKKEIVLASVNWELVTTKLKGRVRGP